MKPVIFYIDDEPHNLTVFEASLPEDWTIKTYDNALKALDDLDKYQPWVILSDQRMPGMTGVQFLEIARRIVPAAIRVIITGYSDENLIVESVRKAHVFDYLRKPWDNTELETVINRGIELYNVSRKSREMQLELQQNEARLRQQKEDLLKLTTELELANKRETEARKEMECWIPPFVLTALHDNIRFPVTKDLVGITYDIIGSSQLHEHLVHGKPLRSVVLQYFSEALLRHGGWRESSSGDSAYGHFGLDKTELSPFESALAVAREFRVALKSISDVNGIQFECGIALHLMKDCVVNIHSISINTPRGPMVQKSFDTTGKDIDILHRMEKVLHKLPGTNIAMSQSFLNGLKTKPPRLIDLGAIKVDNNHAAVPLLLIPSDMIRDEHILQFGALPIAKKKSEKAA